MNNDLVICKYCGRIVDKVYTYKLPARDNIGWEQIADAHNHNCQWVISRAFQLTVCCASWEEKSETG